MPWDSQPAFRERFQHCQDTRGCVPNSSLTMQRRPAIAQACRTCTARRCTKARSATS